MPRKPTKRTGSKDGRRAEGVRLLLAGQSVPVVAKGLGVHVSTVKRWKALDEYLDALAAKEQKVAKAIEGDSDKLAKLATSSIDALAKLVGAIHELEPSDQVRVIGEARQWTIGNKHRVAGDPDNDTPMRTKTADKHQDLATRIGELIEGREQHE